jgi:hypothetical protein
MLPPAQPKLFFKKLMLLLFQTPIFSQTNNISNLNQKGGKKTTLMLDFLILKSEEPEIVCNAFWGQFWFWVWF